MTRESTIELFKENMEFSAGHFTIFSATHREQLHGHNYGLYVALTTEVTDIGLTFDYRDYKNILCDMSRRLNGTFLLPTQSPHLLIEEKDDYIHATFADKVLPFLKEDVTLLPLTNITLEELSNWFLQQLIQDQADLEKNAIKQVVVKVSSAPGTFGSATWSL